MGKFRLAVSQSVTTTLLPTEHMVHTHTLVFFRAGIPVLWPS